MSAASADPQALKAQLKALISQREAIEADIAAASARLSAPGQPGMHDPLIDDEGYPRADIDVHAVRKDRHSVICLTNDHKALTGNIDKLLQQLHSATRQAAGSSAAPPELAPIPVLSSTLAGSSAGATAASPPQQQTTACSHPQSTPPPFSSAAAAAAATTSQSQPMDLDGRGNGHGNGTITTPPTAQVPLRPFALIDDVSDGSPASSAGMQVGDQLLSFGGVTVGGGDELQRVAAVLGRSQGVALEALVLRQGLPLTLTLVPQTWGGRGLLGCHLRSL